MIPISAGTYLKAGTLALVLAAVFFGGRSCGVDAGQKKLEAAQDLSQKKSEALRAASRSFKAFAATFRAITEQTEANASIAAQQISAGEQAAAQARKDRVASDARARALDEALQRERSGCADGERPICGIPLR